MLSERAKRIKPSATGVLLKTVAEMRAKGIELIGMNVGEPDFDTPPTISQAAHQAIDEGFTRYTEAVGIRPLRESICRKLEKENGVTYEPDNIVVCAGAKHAIANALLAICNPGDEIIIPTPCWVSYEDMTRIADGVPVLVATNPDFSLDLQAIRQAITPRTRGIIINTPNNPTGAVYDESALRELAQLACEHDFYIIADEVYEKLIYDGGTHFSIASISPEVWSRTITINGCSKTFAMTGWRVGYAAAAPEIAKAIAAFIGQMTSNICTIAQKAALEAYSGSADDDVARMKEAFAQRRDYMYCRLNAIEGISCAGAQGAFYLMANISGLKGKSAAGHTIHNGIDAAQYLLEEAHIALVPGEAFNCPDHVRFTYSVSIENIEKAMDSLERAVKALR